MIFIFFSLFLILNCCLGIDCFENSRRIRLDNEQLFPDSYYNQRYEYASTPASQARLNKTGFFCGQDGCYSTVYLGLL